MPSLKEDFENAVDQVSNGACGTPPPTKEALRFYGLYSRVRKGAVEETRRNEAPSMWLDPRGRAKWDAWEQASELSEEEAMKEYVDLVQSLVAVKKDSTGRGFLGVEAPSGFDVGEATDEEKRKAPVLDLSHWASLGDHRSIVTVLRQGHPVDARDEENLTALMRAADRGHVEAVKVLLEAGADPNAADDDGQTALHFACFCGHAETAVALLEYGADPSLLDSEGKSARDLASFPQDILDGIKAIEMVKFERGSWQVSPYLIYVPFGVVACFLMYYGLKRIR